MSNTPRIERPKRPVPMNAYPWAEHRRPLSWYDVADMNAFIDQERAYIDQQDRDMLDMAKALVLIDDHEENELFFDESEWEPYDKAIDLARTLIAKYRKEVSYGRDSTSH